MKKSAMYALMVVLTVVALPLQANVPAQNTLLPDEPHLVAPEAVNETTDDREQTAWLVYQNNILDLSGLLGLSQQARHVAQQVLNEQQAPLGLQYRVVSRLAQHWSPTQISEQLRQVLADEEPAWQALQEALEQPRMTRARQLEQQAIQAQASDDYRAYIARLRAQPPMQERQQLIAELDRAMHFSALMQRTRQGVYPHLQAVLSDWQPEANWPQQLQQQVHEFLLYVHRRTSNEELQALIIEYRQAPLQQWLQAVQRQLPQAG